MSFNFCDPRLFQAEAMLGGTTSRIIGVILGLQRDNGVILGYVGIMKVYLGYMG